MSQIDDENYNAEEMEENESANEGESKAEKFQRLAIFRMNRLITGFDSLGKLGNRSSYDYTEEQVTKMFDALKNALEEAESKFKPKKEEKKSGFTF